MSTDNYHQITGAILAGGTARRMNGANKGLIKLNGISLIQYVIDAIKSQTSSIIINTNSNYADYLQFGYSVVKDEITGHPGPLAGIAVCLKEAKTEFLMCVPCDSPLIPSRLSSRLLQSLIQKNAEIAMVHDGVRAQPLFAMLKTGLADSVDAFLMSGENKVEAWYRQHNLVECDFSDQSESFININTQQDLQKAALRIPEI